MKVRIVNRPTGLLNGHDWPDVGEKLEVSDEVGADLCSSGIGVPEPSDDVETAVAPEPEKRGRRSKESTQAQAGVAEGSGEA